MVCLDNSCDYITLHISTSTKTFAIWFTSLSYNFWLLLWNIRFFATYITTLSLKQGIQWPFREQLNLSRSLLNHKAWVKQDDATNFLLRLLIPYLFASWSWKRAICQQRIYSWTSLFSLDLYQFLSFWWALLKSSIH